MTDLLIGNSFQNITANCNRKLNFFVGKLNENASILRKNSAQLRTIAESLGVKSQQLQKLENIKPEHLGCYSVEQKDRILAAIVCQANTESITARKLIQELENSYTELNSKYHALSALANALRITVSDKTMIVGDCKQRPISYYMEEACQILCTWKLYQKSLNLSLDQIKIRNDESIKQFESLTTLPDNLSLGLDQYLLFSTFLMSK